MSTIPLELPLKANEAASIADVIFQQAEGRALTAELRQRLGARVSGMGITSLRCFWGSLQQDPVHASTYYLAVDGLNHTVPQPLLLRIALASAPASGLFPKAILIGRMRPGGGREVVVNAIPFASDDSAAVRTFAEQVDRAFLPRPQGAQPAIAVAAPLSEIILHASFSAFERLLKETGLNLAATAQDYEVCLWAAIRAGWREGYTAEAGPFLLTSQSLEAAKDAIGRAAGCTRFTIDTSPLLTPHGTPPELEERFLSAFPDTDRAWILEEFSRSFTIGEAAFTFSPEQVIRFAVRFGSSLKIHEELYDYIRRLKAGSSFGRAFDFAPSFVQSESLTTPEELTFYLHWLRARGRAAQLVAPKLDLNDGSGLEKLAAAARQFNCTLSIHSGPAPSAEVLRSIGAATRGRWNYSTSGESPDDLAIHIVWLARQLRG